MSAMGTEIDRIAGTTTWAGANLMQASTTSFSFQVGAATGGQNQIKVTIDSMNMGGLNIGSAATDTAAFFIEDADFGQISENSAADTDDFAMADKSATGAGTKLVTLNTAKNGVMTISKNGEDFTANIIGANAATTALNIRTAFKDLGITAEVTTATTVTMTMAQVAAVEGSATDISVSTSANALAGITKIDSAIQEVNVQRSKLGAVSNRLNHTVNNLTNISSNLSAAKGGIEDADFALETTNLAKNQILQQASTAMLAQANASKQNVLSLLQG
jgi:flagellin